MLPILISIPHASTFIPPNIKKNIQLNQKNINSYSDLYTDDIYNIPNVYKIICKVSRLVCDPNRAPDDLIHEAHLSTDGAVIQITEDLKPIYHPGTNPSEEDVRKRIEKFHHSFHEKIENHYDKIKFIVDGHSLKSVGPATKPDAGKKRADIILGNRSFITCNREYTFFFKNYFEKKGYSVAINNPYEGKYILGYHCSRKHLPGIQIEINRKLYMDEKTLKKHPKKIKMFNKIIQKLVNEFGEKYLLSN